MGLITKEVEVKVSRGNWGYCRKYKSDCKIGDVISIKVEDLPPSSSYKVIVTCDYCGKELSTRYSTYTYSIKKSGSFCCHDCKYIKARKTTEKHYGVPHPLQSPEILERVKATNMEIYGVPFTCMSEEVRSKQKETMYKNYGVTEGFKSEVIRNRAKETIKKRYNVDNVSQNDEIKKKKEATMIKHYGVAYNFQSPELYEKMQNTMINLYGVANAMQSKEFMIKSKNTLYQNNTGPCSIQQKYLYQLFGGELNYPERNYSLDIAYPNENICIEYNGGGHDLSVKMNSMTLKEFENKERKRFYYLRSKGWKQIRIVSEDDKLPSDEILLQILETSKQYFKDYPNHSWFEWNITEGIYKNAEHKDGVLFNYGNLRRIKFVA